MKIILVSDQSFIFKSESATRGSTKLAYESDFKFSKNVAWLGTMGKSFLSSSEYGDLDLQKWNII